MRKKILVLLTIMGSLCLGTLAQPLTVYYSKVQPPAFVWDEYHYHFNPQNLADDMAALLRQALGKPVATAPFNGQNGPGIFLLLDSTQRYSANEAAWVSCNGSNSLRIMARYANGLSYGLYTYLQRLGFRFYLPGSQWTIVPTLANAFPISIDRQEWKPWFKHRVFTLSGGMPAVAGLDDRRTNAAEWYKWYRRNRMGSEHINIGGHIGELFNMTHQKEIEQDPSLVAPEDGKNRRYSVSAKLDPTNPRGVNLFSNWVLQQYRINHHATPAWIPWSTYQSVDPADGLGYCQTPECIKRFPSISDQVFHVANVAAQKMATAHPGKGVSLYAYVQRTDTPTLKLAPNVHVGIVASAFHNVSTPMEMIKRWSKKCRHLSIYDYLNIGVWSKEAPYFNLARYFQFLQYTKALRIDGFTFESAPSKFGSALVQYFILQYLCEPYGDIQQAFDGFVRQCFGNAAAPIGKMMQEWYFSDVKLATNYDNTTFHEDELGRFFRCMEQASASGGNGAVQQRLSELKAYLVYLTQHFEYWNDTRLTQQMRQNPALRKQKTEAMLSYTWKLYNTMIFHNTQLNDVLRSYFPEDAALAQRWDYGKSPVFAGLAQATHAEADYRQALKTYLPSHQSVVTDIPPITDAFLEKTARLTPDSIRIRLIDEEAFVSYRYALQVYCPMPGKLTVRYEAGRTKKSNAQSPAIGYVAMVADDYNYHSEQVLQPSKRQGVITFSLPKKGHYLLWLAQNNATDIGFTLRPGKNLVYINKKTIPMNGVMLLDDSDGKYKANRYLAVYAPPGTPQVTYNIIYPDCANYVQLYNAKGKPLAQDNSQSPYYIKATVPPADTGNFLYMTNGLFRWTPVLKNLPPYYFFLKYPPLP
jgi:hypothetical protein